ncbi:rho GTPase-activating protein 5 isoform X1 [Syngnathus scovelli]|uniref:rho GTPase-activating protein 5 isoform X1 n=2 Tax=Syngnathus scovelli TaxID=161590 RepID=UPI002110CDE6|nr:rho GTPase-activating protein 5 isoform X1 [Syngnathus scovelli]XP_049595635.1 rho GTPase-activating protein 5 isoform X1 [Syngnathus scovelli]XP_049595636.1 rho GTPase-activating protein 5 isoform X1 [Syngnathus scovelli]
MAKNKEARHPSFTVSVVGLSGTEKDKGNCGVGKSCLCNRYVRPDADDYYSEHTSVLSTIDFGGRVVNNDHFLYWGEVAHRGEEGPDCKVQVVEQTEFIDDQTFQAHRSTNMQQYAKRAAATKLQSAEKLMYICTDQLGLEQDFEQKQMPDGKLSVDGFVLCVDVSKGCNRKFDDQLKFVSGLYSQMTKSKKPVVLAATKCDELVEQHLRELQAFAASKKNLVLVETSARANVNVELCFNTLLQQLDRSRAKPKAMPYAEAHKVQRQLVAAVTDRFEKLVVQTVRDYHSTWKGALSGGLRGHPDFEDFIALEGSKKARNAFTKHIAQLKREHVERRREEYLATLPKTLSHLLGRLDEVEHLTWGEAQSLIRQRPDFQCWFVALEQTPWDESDHVDHSDRRIPFDLLATSDAERIYRNHVRLLLSEKRRADMKERFKKTLEQLHLVGAGQPWEEVACLLAEDEAYKFIAESDRRDVYGRHQQEIVERAKEDFQEMLFEHAELFYDLDLNATPSCDKMSQIHSVLNEEPRYRALQKLAPDRESLLLKHIGFVYHPTKETCLSGPNCVDLKVEQVLANRLLQQQERARSDLYRNGTDVDKINLCLLGKEGLAQELANEIRAQSTDDEYALDGKLYELELLAVDVNSTLLFSHTWVSSFKPHGCFCVFNSMESLNCVGDCVGRIRAEMAQSRRDKCAAPLPFILMLANPRDGGACKNVPILRHQGQQLANKLQCTFVDIPSDAFARKFTESQVKQGLRGVLDGLKRHSDLLAPPTLAPLLPSSVKDAASEAHLRVVMCAMCWDPFSVDLILSPFLESRCCSAGQPGRANTLLLDKIIGESRRRIQVTVLSYHSAIGVRKDELVHGYILVYSAKRKASMATLRAFLAEVQDVIPVQMVAVTDSQADFFENDDIKELMTEGEHIATEIAAKFTALYSLSQYHRQTEVFTPFFNQVLEKKAHIENAFMPDGSSRERAAELFPSSPLSRSPAYDSYYPESDDDNEAPPPYSPIGDDVQLLPAPSERSAKYRHVDPEGNEYPLHGAPASEHERNLKVPPPVRPKPALPKPSVKKLDPNLLKTIEAGMRSNRRMPRAPTSMHPNDTEASDDYAEPAAAPPPRAFRPDDIYVEPDDARGRPAKLRDSEDENGYERKSRPGRRPSKYKHRSKILFSKTKAYQRRFHSDSDGEEAGPATQRKKKGRAHRGSEEDPLLSPADPWKGGIDNPAVTSDPEQEDKKMKKKKTHKMPKEAKKAKSSKVPKPLYPPTRRTWESNYFGVPLHNLVSPERPIPLFIEKCVDYIERTGLTTEGLYRVSGNKTDQDNIQKQFDQDPSMDFLELDVAINAAAGALKAFFADLPDPLIPYALHPELVQAAKLTDYVERLHVLKEIVSKFPSVNYHVFKYIITHLNRLSQHSKSTLMTADNLSICFWPTLMRPDFENKDTLSSTKLNQAVVEAFIVQSDFFFHGGDLVHGSSGDDGGPPPPCRDMVEALLPLQLPPPLQPQQIQRALPPEPLV